MVVAGGSEAPTTAVPVPLPASTSSGNVSTPTLLSGSALSPTSKVSAGGAGRRSPTTRQSRSRARRAAFAPTGRSSSLAQLTRRSQRGLGARTGARRRRSRASAARRPRRSRAWRSAPTSASSSPARRTAAFGRGTCSRRKETNAPCEFSSDLPGELTGNVCWSFVFSRGPSQRQRPQVRWMRLPSPRRR